MGNGSGLVFRAKGNAEVLNHTFPPHPKHSLWDGLLVYKIREDKNQSVWVGTDRGLYEVGKNGSTGDWWLPCDDKHISTDTTFIINDIVADAQGNLWIATEQGLFVKSATDKCLTPFQMPDNSSVPFAAKNLPSISLDHQEQQLWICTISEGFYSLNLNTFEIQHVPPYTLHGEGDGLRFLEEIFVDNQGTVWLRTSDKGLHLYHPKNQHFQWFNETAALEANEPSSFILMAYEDSKNHLWLLGDYVEVDGYPNLGNEKLSELYPCYAISEAPGGIFWLSTTEGSVKRIDSNTGVIQSYIEDPFTVGFNDRSHVVSAEHIDRNGNFWAGFWGGGAAFFDKQNPANPELFLCRQKSADMPLACQIQSILESRDGRVWFGTATDGLIVFNRKDSSWKHYKKGDKENELKHHHVRCLLEDKSGMIWLGTYGGGIFRFDTEKETFKHFNRSNGLPDD